MRTSLNANAGEMSRMGAEWALTDAPATCVDSWLERAKSGDLQAFDRIMRAQQARIYRTALGLLGNHADALDATQEVFLRLFKYLPRYDASRPLEAWLYRMTVNVARDALRKRSRRAWLIRAFGSAGGLVEAEAPRRLALEEQARVMQRCLDRLPAKERAAIVLRDIEGLSTREVAEILGSSEVTVRSQISRALKKLRRYAMDEN